MALCTAWATHIDRVSPLGLNDIEDAELDLTLLDATMRMASEILYNFTRRKYPGTCSDTVRPIARWRPADTTGATWWGGLWVVPPGLRSPGFGWCTCNRTTDFGCGSVPVFVLPGRPVHKGSVTIKIDGQAFTGFAVMNGNELVRTDGDAWPCCQNMSLADDQPGTWSVSYNYGLTPSRAGRLAAAQLGVQLYLAYMPGAIEDGTCRLPKRVTNITRGNVAAAVLDPLNLFDKGLTGLAEVDMWVKADLYGQTQRNGKVIVPGRHRRVNRID